MSKELIARAATGSAWKLPSAGMPPLHQQVLIELREGPGSVCDVACYIGKHQVEGGGMEDRWVLADVRLDTKQIKRWAHIYPEPPRNELDEAATLLEHQSQLIEQAREALRVFAAVANRAEAGFTASEAMLGGPLTDDDAAMVGLGDLRRARATLKALED